MLEIFSLTDLTGTLSYALIALSYMMTRILWLRVVAVVGLFLEIAYFRFSGGDLKVGIGWNAIFIADQPFSACPPGARARQPQAAGEGCADAAPVLCRPR